MRRCRPAKTTPNTVFHFKPMKRTKPQRILALDPGTRYLGYAVLEGKELLYHGVKTFPSPKRGVATQRMAIKAIEEIITHLHPTVLALESSFPGRNKRLALQISLVRALYFLGRRHGLHTVCYAPATVRKHLCGSGRAGKRDAAFMVAWRYPELKPYLGQNRQWKERFHSHMFDAMAVGLMALSRL